MRRVREKHEQLILRLLCRHGPLSRGELIDMSALSRTTLYDIVACLVDDGTVTVSVPEVARRKRGRPVEKLALNPDAGQVIGIDFARRAVRVATANVTREVIGTASEQHDPGMPWKDRVDTAYRLVGTLVGGIPNLGALSAIGVGVVGPVLTPGAPGVPEDGLGAAFPGTADRDTVATLVRQRFGAPVQLDNNTRLAALAEAQWGAAAGERDVLYLGLSYGIGGGLVVGGTLHRGAYGVSGEFGHITVEPGGAACSCGGAGCLETVASVGAVLDAYRAAGGTAADLPGLVAALDAGDRAAGTVLARAGARIGKVLATLCNTVDPRVIVLGGELAEVGPAVLEPVEQELALGIMPGARVQLSLRPAKLGEVGAALGAIALLRPRAVGLPPLDLPGGENRTVAPGSAAAAPRPGPGVFNPELVFRGRIPFSPQRGRGRTSRPAGVRTQGRLPLRRTAQTTTDRRAPAERRVSVVDTAKREG